MESYIIERLVIGLEISGIKRYGMNMAVAEKTGYSVGMVAKVLSGHAALTDRFIQAVCSAFGICKEWVENGTEPVLIPTIGSARAHKVIKESFTGKFYTESISDNRTGITVFLKNGGALRFTNGGEIHFNLSSEEPFQQLRRSTIELFTEQGAGQIPTKVFHTALMLALNSNQRNKLLEKFGNEGMVAAEFQRMKESGAFGSKRQGHLFLNWMYNFFKQLRIIILATSAPALAAASGSQESERLSEVDYALQDVATREAVSVLSRMSEPQRWRAVAMLKDLATEFN